MGDTRKWLFLVCSSALACGGSGGDGSGTDATSVGDETGTGDTSGTTTTTDTDSADTGTDEGEPKFDVGEETDSTTTGDGDVCKVQDDGDAMGPCENKAPPDSFSPEVQWTFTPDDGNTESLSQPLVGNLTDDNNDGEIDLCDVPDVVATAFPLGGGAGSVYVLDGGTGALHWQVDKPTLWRGCPGLADIDNDGIPEIVVQSDQNTLYAYENDGTFKWESDVVTGAGAGPCVAFGDVDNDGDVEIAFDGYLLDHEGNLIVTVQGGGIWSSAVILADLDGDDDLEIVQPSRAYHHDGTLMWDSGLGGGGRHAIADLDMDGEPEIMVGGQGLSVIEHDGTVKYSGLTPVGGFGYDRPPAIHDIDGNGIPNYMNSTGGTFAVYEPDGTVVWSKQVDDSSGSAGSTAFDFLGDGGAEAMYGDEEYIWAYDSDGTPKVMQPRSSATVVEYPAVADVDNDGSAEIVVPSSHSFVFGDEPNPYPLVQVLRDQEDRWIQARRIWNQHTYHVTNVREDGTIPEVEPKHWLELNTFRTNAQIEGGSICEPEG